jgi:RNA polymerase sigma-70 factor, ECF subfamily
VLTEITTRSPFATTRSSITLDSQPFDIGFDGHQANDEGDHPMETGSEGVYEGQTAFPLGLGMERVEAASRDLPGIAGDCDSDGQAAELAKVAELIEVAERYRSRLLWLATRITNRREDAEDIVQQAIMKAYTNLAKFRGESRMRTWLTAIVQNTAREYARSGRGRTFIPLESDPHREGAHDELELQDPAMDPEERFERWERVEKLYSAIGRMSGSNQRLIQLCVFEEMPYAQVASQLNTRLSAVKSRMFRSKHLLRTAAAEFSL